MKIVNWEFLYISYLLYEAFLIKLYALITDIFTVSLVFTKKILFFCWILGLNFIVIGFPHDKLWMRMSLLWIYCFITIFCSVRITQQLKTGQKYISWWICMIILWEIDFNDGFGFAVVFLISWIFEGGEKSE